MRTVLAPLVWMLCLFGLACSGADSSKPAADGGIPTAGQGGAAGTTLVVAGTGTSTGTAGLAALDGGAAGAEPDGAAPTTRGPFAPVGLEYTVTPGAPIDVPANAWTFVAFPDAKCANGTSTGIAVQPAENAAGLLVFMQGGGACWDAVSCLELKASIHLEDTVDESVVLSEAAQAPLFDRSQVLNPFRNYHYVYIPYCTGDLHTGTRAATYVGANGPVTIEHRGAQNIDAYLARLVPTFSTVERVVVSGISAGGFGASLNWWRYQAAFDHARVDVFDDAGLLVDAGDARFEAMVASWAMVLPAGCAECGKKMSVWLPFYADRLGAPRRYALAGFLGDGVIAQYFALDAAAIETQMLALRTTATANATNQKMFFLTGTAHSVLGEGLVATASDGASLVPWLTLFESDSTSWDHAGP